MVLHRAAQEHLEFNSEFISRHIGPSSTDIAAMLKTLGFDSMDAFIHKVIPESILSKQPLQLGHASNEADVLRLLGEIAEQNSVVKSFIGMGYYNTYTPNVILRNLLENAMQCRLTWSHMGSCTLS